MSGLIVKNSPPAGVQTCEICLKKPGDYCGLLSANETTKTILVKMFAAKFQQNSDFKICVSCLVFVEKAATFKKMAKTSHFKVHLTPRKPEQTEQCDRSISLEPRTSDDSEEEGENEQMNGANDQESSDEREEKVSCLDPKCDRKFLEVAFMELHFNRVHGKDPEPSSKVKEQTYKCEICQEEFANEDLLIQHRSAHKRSSYTKAVVTKTTDGSSKHTNKMHHDKSKVPKVVYKCCGKVYRSLYTYKYHQSQYHTTEVSKPMPKNIEKKPPLYTCCGRAFSTAYSHRIHWYKSHPGPWINPYSKRKNLHESLKKSKEENIVFQCKFCTKSFSNVISLNTHIAQCQVVDKQKFAPQFIEGRGLSCCGFIMTKAEYFQRHKTKKHPHEKLTKSFTWCEVCFVLADGLNELKDHYGKHHSKGNPMKCKRCGKQYITRQGLRVHIQKDHK